MRRSARASISGMLFALALAALVAPLWLLQSSVTAFAQSVPDRKVTMEWFGWSHFKFTSPTGKVILTNPFTANPDSPIKAEDVTKADLILTADGHGDEVGSTVQIAKQTGARTYSAFELGTWLMEQGVPQTQVIRGNPGERMRLEGITVRMVGSVHGSGLTPPTATTPYGGPAAGFFITFENGWTVYFSGSTAATQDQALWGQMYRPDVAILHMGAGHEPMDFAMQAHLLQTDNPNLSAIFPHHHRVVQTAGQTTIAEVQEAMDDMGLGLSVTPTVLGQVYTFTK